METLARSRFCILVSLLLTASGAVGAKKKEAPAPAPPPAVPQTVVVPRDGKVQVPLRIYGTRSQTLTFLIREQSAHGTLTAPRRVGPESAVVTFTPPQDLNVTKDRFSYAVKSNEGVSAAVDVTIEIVDLVPQLIVPDTVEFPSLLLGETAERSITVSNRGGGIAEGELQVAAPWKVEGSPVYRLPSMEEAAFKIVFAPLVAGFFQGEVRFSSQIDRTTALSGIGRAPLAVRPAKLDLQRTGVDPIRAGVFQLTNHTAEPLLLTIKASERLVLSRELRLAPGEDAAIPLQVRPGDLGALEEEIRVEGGSASATLLVKAAPVAAILRAPSPVFTFGTVPAGQVSRAQFPLENGGGAPAQVRLHVPLPFSIEEGAFSIAPGGRRLVTIALAASPVGAVRAILQIESSAGRTDVPIEAEVRESASRPEIAEARPDRPSRQREEEASPIPTSFPRPETTDDQPRKYVPAKVSRVGTKDADIEWLTLGEVAKEYRAEVRRLSLGADRQLVISWDPFPHFSAVSGKGRMVGTLAELQAGQLYAVRVRPVAVGGELGEPLFEMTFRTPPRPLSGLRLTWTRGLVLVFAICLAAVVWQRLRDRRQPGL